MIELFGLSHDTVVLERFMISLTIYLPIYELQETRVIFVIMKLIQWMKGIAIIHSAFFSTEICCYGRIRITYSIALSRKLEV